MQQQTSIILVSFLCNCF